jgi:hypothetical protein
MNKGEFRTPEQMQRADIARTVAMLGDIDVDTFLANCNKVLAWANEVPFRSAPTTDSGSPEEAWGDAAGVDDDDGIPF